MWFCYNTNYCPVVQVNKKLCRVLVICILLVLFAPEKRTFTGLKSMTAGFRDKAYVQL
jgi:hypothetical protein